MAASAEPRRDPNDKRRQILDAALVLFAERGFHGTAVPLVAERAGVGAGTLYRYFVSKEALVNALYVDTKRALGVALLDGFPRELPARQLFAECWRRLTAFALNNPHAFKFLDLHHGAPYLDQTSRSVDEQVLTILRGVAEQGVLDHVVKKLPPELLMSIVYGAVVGVVRASDAGHLPIPLAQALAQAEACAWEAIRA